MIQTTARRDETAYRFQVFVLLMAIFTSMWPLASEAAGTNTNWPTYGNDPGGSRYAPPTQINRGT